MRSKPLLFGLCALILIWGAVVVVMRATDQHTSTPEKVTAAMEKSPWLMDETKDIPVSERQEHIDGVIAQVNLLDFEQRRSMRETNQAASQRFFQSLTPEEKSHFLQETVENHFKSVMKAFNKMDPEERKRLVKSAQKDVERNRVEGQNMEKLKEEDEKAFEVMVEKGLGAYYETASAETKMDLAPLMEEMQQRIRGFPNR